MAKRNQGGRPVRAKKASSERVEIRLTPDELRQWTEAANDAEVSLSMFVRSAVDHEVGRSQLRRSLETRGARRTEKGI